MLSENGNPYVYEKCQLIEVICQLRFPTILSIETKLPAEYQDRIRDLFPRYHCQEEGTATGKSTHNHVFVTEDGGYKLSLTQTFVALSTMRYRGWTEFAGMLDEPLGQFYQIYHPAYFERVGLRYVNGISRQKLNLEGRRWNDLFQPVYLGILDDDDVAEETVTKCSIDIEQKLDEVANLKLHAGPGMLKRTVHTKSGMQTIQEPDARFIFDQDLYATGNIHLQRVTETLETLHEHADRIFSDAITDTLHEAMEAVEL